MSNKLNSMIVDDEEMSRSILEQFIIQTPFLTLIKACSGPIEAATLLESQSVDVIFLDIEMPEMNGMEFIQSMTNAPQIILTTSHKDYAIEAFQHNVTGYLVKPISYPSFLKAATKARDIFKRSQFQHSHNSILFVKSDSRLVKVNPKDILWIEALREYVVINKIKEKLMIHMTMKEMEKKLLQNDFVRIHRSFIVRLDKIVTIEDNTLVINNKALPIGRKYKDDFMKRLNLL